MKVKISAENGTITVNEYKYLGAQHVRASYPIILAAIMPMRYFQVKPPISIVSMMMGNPMMVMMLVMGVVVIAFPNMMAGMSPEDLAELKKASANSADPMKELTKLMGGNVETKDEDED